MKSELIRETRDQHLILSSQSGTENEHGYRLQMLVNNKIHKLLPCAYSEIDGKLYVYYDISDKSGIKEYFSEKRVDEKGLRLLIEGMADVLDELGKYLISPDYLLALPGDIFIDAAGSEISFVCYPFVRSDISEKLLRLSEFLLSKLKLNDSGAIYYGYAFYQACAEGKISSGILRKILTESPEPKENGSEKREAERSAYEQSVWDSFFNDEENVSGNSRKAEDRKNDKKAKKNKESVKVKTAEKKSSRRNDEESDSALDGLFGLFRKKAEKTGPSGRRGSDSEDWMKSENAGFARASVMINPQSESYTKAAGNACQVREESSAYARLVPDRAGSSIVLKDSRYIVGKKCAGADIISASDKVSRIHARLVKDDGSYLLTDMSSQNGTFVNGRKIVPGSQVRLLDRDRVRFGDVEYTYRKRSS